MTPEEEISKIETELEDARRDLQETLSAVNAKIESEVERVEDTLNETFNPDELVRNNIIGAACIAGVLGFLVGSSKYRAAVVPVVLGALGYTIWSGLSKEGSDEDGREPVGS